MGEKVSDYMQPITEFISKHGVEVLIISGDSGGFDVSMTVAGKFFKELITNTEQAARFVGKFNMD